MLFVYKRRRVTTGTPFSRRSTCWPRTATADDRFGFVGVPERVDVHCQGIELFVTEALARRGIWKFPKDTEGGQMWPYLRTPSTAVA